MDRTPPLTYETRSEVISRYIRRLTRETRWSEETWSVRVVEEWHARVPESARGNDFRDSGPVAAQLQHNGRKIRRWGDSDVSARPSIDVEESLVQALPEPYRSECLAELTARHGGLFVAIAGAADGPLRAPAELLTECGQALQALGKLLADGKIAATDSTADLLDARKECLDVSACVQGLVAQIDAALDQQRAVAASGVKA